MATNLPVPDSTSPGTLGAAWVLKDQSVNIASLDERLKHALHYLADAHQALFAKPLVITSGNDGHHVLGSAHFQNRAVDVRSFDVPPDAELLFGAVLSFAAPILGFRCFDERFPPKDQHWHIEIPEAGA